MSDLGTNRDDLALSAGLKITDDADAKENRDTFMQYRGGRQKWYSDKVENDRFYHNVQYTDDEERDIISRGQAPVVINVTFAIIKQIISFLTANSPEWYVDPVGDADKDKVYLFRKLLDATWYQSRGHRQFSSICKDVGICGVGYGMVTPRASNPFGVDFRRIAYHNVYIDPYTSEFDYSDADAIIISKLLSKNQASIFLNKTVEEIEEYAESDETMSLPEDDPATTHYPRYVLPATNMKSRVRIIQRMTFENVDTYVVSPIDNRVPLTRKIYFKVDERMQGLEARGLIKIEKKSMKTLTKYISLGKYCEKYYLPMSNYNITPFIDEFTGNPYPLGTLDFLYGLQRTLNKFMLLTLLNASLSNNMKLLAVKNSINKQQYEDSYAVPGSVIEWEPNSELPQGGKPEPLDPVPLSSAFFTFPQMIISMMEYITGIFGVMQGNPEEAPRTASGLMSLQNFGGQKVKLIGRAMEDALTTVGNNVITLYQNYAGFNQVISYFNEQNGTTEQLNFNTLNVYDGGRFKIENDLNAGKYVARVQIRQDYGSERQAKAQVLGNIMAQTKNMALLKPILKLADIPEADQILKEVDEIAKLTQQGQQSQQAIKRLEQVNTQLQNEILQKSQKVELTQFIASLEVLKSKLEKEYGIRTEKEFADVEMQLQDLVNQVGAANQQPQEVETAQTV